MYSVLVLFLSFVLWIASEKTLLHFRHELRRPAGQAAALALQRTYDKACCQPPAGPGLQLAKGARRPPAAHSYSHTARACCHFPCRSRTARRLFWYLLACAIGAVLVRWLQSLEGVGMMWVFLSAVRRGGSAEPRQGGWAMGGAAGSMWQSEHCASAAAAACLPPLPCRPADHGGFDDRRRGGEEQGAGNPLASWQLPRASPGAQAAAGTLLLLARCWCLAPPAPQPIPAVAL